MAVSSQRRQNGRPLETFDRYVEASSSKAWRKAKKKGTSVPYHAPELRGRYFKHVRVYLVELLEQETLPRSRRPREKDRLPFQDQVDHVPLLCAEPLWIEEGVRGRNAETRGWGSHHTTGTITTAAQGAFHRNSRIRRLETQESSMTPHRKFHTIRSRLNIACVPNAHKTTAQLDSIR